MHVFLLPIGTEDPKFAKVHGDATGRARNGDVDSVDGDTTRHETAWPVVKVVEAAVVSTHGSSANSSSQ